MVSAVPLNVGVDPGERCVVVAAVVRVVKRSDDLHVLMGHLRQYRGADYRCESRAQAHSAVTGSRTWSGPCSISLCGYRLRRGRARGEGQISPRILAFS